MAAIYTDLKGRTVIVTGGAGGIGEAIVRSFAKQGARVAFLDIDRPKGEALAAQLGDDSLFVPCDLTDIPALQAAIETVRARFGPVHVLINNAGHDERHDVPDVTEAYWDARMAVNLKHQFFAAQAVLPDMQAAGGGVILNLGSTSWMQGHGGMPAYTAAKSAVIGLTRALARRYGPDNIRVNAIAPGWIMTERQIALWLTPEAEADMLKSQSLKRKLYPDDIARFVVFMASEEASACTAQHYVVDGGWV